MSQRDLYTFLETLMRAPLRAPESRKGTVRECEELIGILFAYYVQIAHYCPGKPAEIGIEILQGRFQEEGRAFFQDRAREYGTRKWSARQLRRDYFPKQLHHDFRQESVERLVTDLACDERYMEIGRAVVEGAQEHHRRVVRKGGEDNYRGEHEAIRQALMRIL